jgi:signal transduction histidine kinase
MNLRKKTLIILGVTFAVLITWNMIITMLYFTPQKPQTGQPSPPPPPAGGGLNIMPWIQVLSILMVSVVFSVVTIVLLEKLVLSRLAKLSISVKSIGSSGNVSARVSLTGRDELSSLADEINKMLVRIEQDQSELKSMNEKLRVVGKLTRHDVRNKLAAVTGNAYLVKKKLDDHNETSKHMEEIESAVQQMERIFSFAETYEMLGVEELAYIDVEKTVEEAVSLFSDLKGVEVMNDCRGLTVLADSLLRQVFYNLIDNSLKYGEKAKKIRVYYEETDKSQLKVVYEDDGVGIPDGEKLKLFSEGYGKGTGYGLYLIKKICDEYGWAIRETGEQGEGAQFTITIPMMNKNGKENYQLHQHRLSVHNQVNNGLKIIDEKQYAF